MALRQILGNLTDKVGTLSANISKTPVAKGGILGVITKNIGKERGISEKIAGNRPTTYTGSTSQSRQAGFTPYTPANMSNRSTGLSISAPKTPEQATQPPLDIRLPNNNSTQTKEVANIPSGEVYQEGGSQGTNISQSQQEAMQRAEEEKRLIQEQEAKNEDFRTKLSGEYGELRTRFGDLLGSFNEKLNTLPRQLQALNQQYKDAISQQQNQEIGQVGQKREQVAEQQKSGLASIAEQAGQRIRQGAGRLGSLGMASSAAGMFQRAIQNEANKSAKDLLTQAANNYQELDSEENRIKSAYKTMLDDIDAEEQANIQEIQNNANAIIAQINDNLQKSGEFENLDKNELRDIYLQELTNRFSQAKQASESYKKQLEDWRRNTESSIRQVKNKMVQDFIPKEIQSRELSGISQPQSQNIEEELNPRLLRRTPEDNEDIATPTGLQAITRRLRQNINQ